MKRKDIIACRRKLQVPDRLKDKWKTLADVCFDGDWVSPIQKISNSKTGPVLVAKHWLDVASVKRHRLTLKKFGYLPGMRFNCGLDRALEDVCRTRADIYITQACHFLPKEDRQKYVPTELLDRSIEGVTLHEIGGRQVIALGKDAQRGLSRFRIQFDPCTHPSYDYGKMLKEMLHSLFS